MSCHNGRFDAPSTYVDPYFNTRDTAHNCVGLLMSSHMIGNKYPGGFHDGFFKFEYHFESPGMTSGANTCLVAAEIPPSMSDPKIELAKMMLNAARSCVNGKFKIDGIQFGNLSDKAALATNVNSINAVSRTALVPNLMNNLESVSAHPPPRIIWDR